MEEGRKYQDREGAAAGKRRTTGFRVKKSKRKQKRENLGTEKGKGGKEKGKAEEKERKAEEQ